MTTIARARTSAAAFLGWVPLGAAGQPARVYDTGEASHLFGRHRQSVVLAAVDHFFTCGGREAWVLPIAAGGDPVVPDTPDYDAAFAPEAPVWAGLDACHGVGLIAAPGASHVEVLAPLQSYAARRGAFLVADCAPDATAASLRTVPAPLLGDAAASSALYVPWLLVPDPGTPGATVPAPPSGAVAGVLARVDEASGVWTAAAGTDAPLLAATGLAQAFTAAERDALSAAGVNLLAQFTGMAQPVVWGGRTLASVSRPELEWKYVNVRRFLLFLQRSLDEGTRWAVSEPNDEPAWARVRADVNAFLYALFRDGALAGRTPREAYVVRCDRTTMTQHDIDQGRLICEIGIAPVKPAEFVVVRFGQQVRRHEN